MTYYDTYDKLILQAARAGGDGLMREIYRDILEMEKTHHTEN